MATCLDVVTNAMRLSRIIGPGKDPKAAESETGLDCLQSLYDSWLAGGMFGRLVDTYLTGNATAEEGRRYYVPAGFTLTPATSIYTPTCGPMDTWTSGSTRQPRDLSVYEALTSTGTRTVRLYDRTEWVDLLDLALSDIAPLSDRGGMGLAAALATHGAFAAVFGAEPGERVGVLAAKFLHSLSYKLGSTRDRGRAEYF